MIYKNKKDDTIMIGYHKSDLQWDCGQTSILVNGKTVYKANKLKIDMDVSANWLLKKLFKIVYIWVNGCGRSIMIFPKYGIWSCIVWNLSGGKFKVSKDFFNFAGTFKIEDITRKSFRLVKVINKLRDNRWEVKMR